jgi:hypothetical protein
MNPSKRPPDFPGSGGGKTIADRSHSGNDLQPLPLRAISHPKIEKTVFSAGLPKMISILRKNGFF